MAINRFIGGKHTHYHQYRQDKFPFESRSERITLVFKPSELKEYQELARQRGLTEIGPFLRYLVALGKKYEKFEHMTLGEIVK